MANQLLTIGDITNASLFSLENSLRFTKNVTREYDSRFGVTGAKVGNTVQVRKPPLFTGRVGQALSVEDATETSVPLVLTTQQGVDLAFSSADRELSLDNFRQRFVAPMLIKVANKIDADGLLQYLNVANSVGTPGTIPNAMLTYSQAKQKLDEEATPYGNRCMLIGPAMEATIVDANRTLFNAQVQIAEQYEEGMMGRAAGFDWYETQNILSNTIGALGGTGVVNAGGQTGGTLVTKSWSNSVTNLLLAGNVFTIGSGTTAVNAVNPIGKQKTGSLRQFVVTANANSDGSGNATLSIYPPIIASGPYQNVDAAPQASAVINVLGAANTVSPQGLAFHQGAFALGMADMELPEYTVAQREKDDELGLAIRVIQAYDVNSDRTVCRVDVLYGWTTLRAELACRVQS